MLQLDFGPIWKSPDEARIDIEKGEGCSILIWWRSVFLVGKPEYQEKTTGLSQVTDKLYHIMLYKVHIALTTILPRFL